MFQEPSIKFKTLPSAILIAILLVLPGNAEGSLHGSGSNMNFSELIAQQQSKPNKKPSAGRSQKKGKAYSKPRNPAIMRAEGLSSMSVDLLETKYENAALRTRPLMNSEVIAKLKRGTKLIIVERHVSWYKVRVHTTGRVGFIHQYMVQRF